MTFQQALESFDEKRMVDGGPLVPGITFETPYDCGVPVIMNSQEGVSRLFCGVCGFTFTEIGQQWIVTDRGTRGIRMPKTEAVGAACL